MSLELASEKGLTLRDVASQTDNRGVKCDAVPTPQKTVIPPFLMEEKHFIACYACLEKKLVRNCLVNNALKRLPFPWPLLLGSNPILIASIRPDRLSPLSSFRPQLPQQDKKWLLQVDLRRYGTQVMTMAERAFFTIISSITRRGSTVRSRLTPM